MKKAEIDLLKQAVSELKPDDKTQSVPVQDDYDVFLSGLTDIEKVNPNLANRETYNRNRARVRQMAIENAGKPGWGKRW